MDDRNKPPQSESQRSRDLTQRCIESLEKRGMNPHLTQANDKERDIIVRAWYWGYADAVGATPTVSVENFTRDVLTELKAAA